jgi:hypothetical protein
MNNTGVYPKSRTGGFSKGLKNGTLSHGIGLMDFIYNSKTARLVYKALFGGLFAGRSTNGYPGFFCPPEKQNGDPARKPPFII